MNESNLIIDAIGHEVPRDEYQRVISLVPSITETLFDFGLEEKIIGVTRYCIHPSKAQDPPRVIVGGSKSPKINLIKKLQPDLVIVNKEEQKLEHVQQLQQFTTVFVTYPRTVQDSLTMLNQLALLLMIEDDLSVQRIIFETEKIIREVKTWTSTIDVAEKPRVFCPIWKNPWMTINHDTYIHDLIETAGGWNVFRNENDRYPVISLHKIRQREPEMILLPSEPYNFTRMEANELCNIFQPENVKSSKMAFHLVDGSYLSWYGSRTRRGLMIIHEIIRQHYEKTSKR